MFKLIALNGDTIRLDDKGVSEMVSKACSRSGSYVEGVVTRPDAVTLICTDAPDEAVYTYRFTPLALDTVCDDVYARLRERYDSSFRTVAAFQLAKQWWTLTEKKD